MATLTLTSGSSGAPKAAAHSYAGPSSQRLRGTAIVEVPAARSLAIVIAAVSRFRSGHCLTLVGGGATLVLRDKHPLVGCTHASLVLTQLWRRMAQPLEGMTLKGVLLGGAMILEVLTKKAAALGIHCWVAMG